MRYSSRTIRTACALATAGLIPVTVNGGEPQAGAGREGPRRLAIVAFDGEVASPRCWIEVLGDPSSVERIELRSGESVVSRGTGDALATILPRPCRDQSQLVATAYKDDRILDVVSWQPCEEASFRRVRLVLPNGDRAEGQTTIEVTATGLNGHVLRGAECFWNGRSIGKRGSAPLTFEHEFQSGVQGVLRLVAELDDGTELEDALLVNAAGYSENLTVLGRDLVVAVTESGQPLPALQPDELAVVESGVELPVASVRPAASLPLAMALVVDASGSRRGGFQRNIALSLAELEESLAGQQKELSLIAFKEKPALLTGPVSAFGEILPALRRLAAGESTALYDALVFTALQLQGGFGRKAIVAITDGQDNASRTSLSGAIDRLRKLGTPVYLVVPDFWQKVTKADLEQRFAVLASETSGGLVFPGRRETWSGAFQAIRKRLGEQVLVSYHSLGGPPEAVRYHGKKRGVRVVVLGARGSCDR